MKLESTFPAGEFDPKPLVPQPLLEGPLAALLEWQAMAEGAYSPNTLRAQKADGAIFQGFCESRGETYLPADPKTIRAFIENCVEAGKKPATIKRYVATIARVHIAASLLNPCSSEAVRLGLKKMGRETSARQDQAHPLGWKDIKEFIDSAGVGLRADRDRAMLCVAYETLARRGELVALDVKDIDFHPDGTGIALIRRGKTDEEGQGRSAYLSRETVRWLKRWMENAKISEGVVFRRLVGSDKVGSELNPGSIAPIFKRVAKWIGMPERFVKLVSGHSTRVGATQDLAALDIDLAAITQAGGWKSTRMPLQYAEKINAARSGMARAAEKSGRNSASS
ncbi:MAG TPA: tyrosine-type recombinase/integrase [Steroidobacteraceae bacterium]|jgi:integrase